jgi:hypothetical protein
VKAGPLVVPGLGRSGSDATPEGAGMITQRRRLERLRGTLMKLVGQMESCMMIMDDIERLKKGREE